MKRIIFYSLIIVATTVCNTTLKLDGFKVGDLASDFSLKNVNDEMVSLKDMENTKGFILIFTCNSCPYSVAYEDRIIDLDRKYASKGYPVIAINPNDSKRQPKDNFEKMKRRAEEKEFTFPYLLDETQKIARAYGATRTPHVFLLNKENEGLRVAYIGAIDNNTDNPAAADKKYVEDAVESLLSKEPIKVTKSKAIGCGIKWKRT